MTPRKHESNSNTSRNDKRLSANKEKLLEQQNRLNEMMNTVKSTTDTAQYVLQELKEQRESLECAKVECDATRETVNTSNSILSRMMRWF